MKLTNKIFLIWIVAMALLSSLLLVPGDGGPTLSLIMTSLQVLLAIVCFCLFRYEQSASNRTIFVNFMLAFGVSLLLYFGRFVGTVVFTSDPYARLYFHQYVPLGLYFLLVTLAVVYLTVDVLFKEVRVLPKYALALVIAVGSFGYYYHPILLNPRYLYTTPEIQDWKVLDRAYSEHQKEYGLEPSPEQLAGIVSLNAWKGSKPVGLLHSEAKVDRVKELYRYLLGSNYKILLYRPLYLNVVYMCVVCMGFILLFFGYQYAKDPPQGAYIEKIMFMLLVLCSSELLHAWSFAQSVEWETFSQLMSLGQYVSIGVLLALVVAFRARLKFITSPKGEFYEQELATNASGITRWRDAVDDLILNFFFNRKAIIGRMYVDPSRGK